MRDSISLFEAITRRAYRFSAASPAQEATEHPFDVRNIHPSLPSIVRSLFDDGHYSQATFEAFKFIDREVERHGGLSESGFKLMMHAFGGDNPSIRLTPMKTPSEADEQKGYQFLFAGGVLAIRNPRGHEYGILDDPDTCLDHLGLASMLLRRLEDARFL